MIRTGKQDDLKSGFNLTESARPVRVDVKGNEL
jgi:hypothetical protein